MQCHCELHKRLVGNERHSIIGNVRLNEVPVELLARRQFPSCYRLYDYSAMLLTIKLI